MPTLGTAEFVSDFKVLARFGLGLIPALDMARPVKLGDLNLPCAAGALIQLGLDDRAAIAVCAGRGFAESLAQHPRMLSNGCSNLSSQGGVMSHTPPPDPMDAFKDVIKSYVRTWVPIVLGFAATFLTAMVAERLGINIDGKVAYAVLYGLTTMALYAAGRWLEMRRWAPARLAGRLILSLGADLGKPSYTPQATSPGAVRPRSGPPKEW